jgi:FxLD family lantipeptide
VLTHETAPRNTAPPPGSPLPTAVADPLETDLDITFLEAGDSVEHLIYMTDDGCGKSCQSACTSTCG